MAKRQVQEAKRQVKVKNQSQESNQGQKLEARLRVQNQESWSGLGINNLGQELETRKKAR